MRRKTVRPVDVGAAVLTPVIARVLRRTFAIVQRRSPSIIQPSHQAGAHAPVEPDIPGVVVADARSLADASRSPRRIHASRSRKWIALVESPEVIGAVPREAGFHE